MSTNITKQKRDELVSKINSIREFLSSSSDENATRLLGFLGELENDVTNKHYGLIFEEHRESIDEKLETALPVLTEDESLEIDRGGQQNFLIEGDNLASLKLLEKTHRGKIDVIYIDPPYNRGSNDFIYDDDYVDKNDTFKHSKWCSFMEKRLRIARRLLTENGVIFISIDDNEQATLKLLCDEIFGEDLFLGCIIQNKGNAQNDAKNIQKNHDYILVYAKKRLFIENKEISLLWSNGKIQKECYLDKNGNYYYLGSSIVTGGEGGILNARPNLGYSIYYNLETDDKIAIDDYDKDLAKTSNDENKIYKTNFELIRKGYKVIRPPKKQNKLGCWTWSIKKFNSEKDKIHITENDVVYQKKFVPKIKIRKENNLFYFDEDVLVQNSKSVINFSTAKGTSELIKLFGDKVFSNPKNVEMLLYIINLFHPQASALAVPNPRGNSQLSTVNSQFSTILDFFAGSGTTGHAVLKLNAADNGNRRFILCTNNQNNICRDITYERLRRVIEKENYSASLKYFRVDFVDINDKLYYEYADELLAHTRELVELENAINFNKNPKIAICLTEEELDEFTQKLEESSPLEKIYVGHDVQLTDEQETLFENLGVEVIQIPEYYYDED